MENHVIETRNLILSVYGLLKSDYLATHGASA
ncbi:hypothetical protein HNQ91_001016 [Filimonas zeae]|nr:hypothetical protein [Filimonas zeae]